MSVLHGYLLGGLVLAGLPILVHLIMRQRPKPLPFPAFRFLKQRHLINRRKLRLQNLLLMLLRILLIALLCFALSQPKMSLHGLGFSSDQPVDAILVFDTSPSMEYQVSKKSRLDEARERARELLGQMANGSRVAVFDTSEEAGDDSITELRDLTYARSRIEALRVRPANAALNRQLERGWRLLSKVGKDKKPRPRFLYLFSDRTRACWDAAEASRLSAPEGVQTVFLDVGTETPLDLAIDSVEIDPPVAAPGARIEVRVAVRASGGDFENEVTCRIENAPDDRSGERQKPVKVANGETQVITFLRQAPQQEGAEYPCQVTVELATADALRFNNKRHATFLVRQPRQVLTIADTPAKAFSWKTALEALATERPADAFSCQVVRPAEAETLTPERWRNYKVVCLFEVKKPSAALWAQLAAFVKEGGGLVLVPGGDELTTELVKEYNDGAEKVGLLPARLDKVIVVPEDKTGVPWAGFSAQHALTAQFRKWSQADTPDLEKPETRPLANAYWEVVPRPGATVIAEYADNKKRPALAERSLGRGRIVQFTTVLDGRLVDRTRPWNNYFSETWFGLVLVNEVCRYLSGDAARPELNFTCAQGQTIGVALVRPASRGNTRLQLQGPELSESESALTVSEGQTLLDLKQAVAPGNYTVWNEKNELLAGFSLNVRTEESVLDRVPVEELEKVLGPGAVIPLGRSVNLREALKGVWSPPFDLMPWLLLLVLLGLAIEGLLANKVYARPPAEGGDTPGEPSR